MSNYHVLRLNKTQDVAEVVFHIAIPNILNSVNNSYRDVLIEHYDLKNFISRVPYLNTTSAFAEEVTQLKNGELFEFVQQFKFSSGKLSLVNKRSEIDNQFTNLSTIVTQKIQKEFAFYGLNRDVI